MRFVLLWLRLKRFPFEGKNVWLIDTSPGCLTLFHSLQHNRNTHLSFSFLSRLQNITPWNCLLHTFLKHIFYTRMSRSPRDCSLIPVKSSCWLFQGLHLICWATIFKAQVCILSRKSPSQKPIRPYFCRRLDWRVSTRSERVVVEKLDKILLWMIVVCLGRFLANIWWNVSH